MRFPGPEVPRFAVGAASAALVAIAAGALLTNGIGGPALIYRMHPHTVLAIIAGALATALMVWLIPSNTPLWVRATSGTAVGLFAIDALLASVIQTRPLPLALSLAHACLAPMFFSALVVVAAYTWPGWEDRPFAADLSGFSLVAQMADVTPFLTVVQIALGAAYRHKALGVMPHMAGAMLVALPLLIISVVLLQQFPKHASIRPLAISTMSILLLQLSLGIGAFVMRLLDFDTLPGFAYVAAGHVCAGALTLAASVLTCIELRRCRPETLLQ